MRPRREHAASAAPADTAKMWLQGWRHYKYFCVASITAFDGRRSTAKHANLMRFQNKTISDKTRREFEHYCVSDMNNVCVARRRDWYHNRLFNCSGTKISYFTILPKWHEATWHEARWPCPSVVVPTCPRATCRTFLKCYHLGWLVKAAALNTKCQRNVALCLPNT